MFKRVLVANRGDAAVRIIRACRELGIETVSVHSTADSQAMHTRLADQTICIGPPQPTQSYLNSHAILSAAQILNADAIHPGIGFLAEDENFARLVQDHGITFIGPEPDHIQTMGDKISAISTAKSLGLMTIPGSDGDVSSLNDDDLLALGRRIGYPLLVKATAGGGGRGIVLVRTSDELVAGVSRCRHEAAMLFNNESVYMERYFSSPRHIEVQVLADGTSAIHLGVRDCSVQRRHQKIVEESPAPGIDQELIDDLCRRSVEAVHRYQYCSAGTLEFLYEEGKFYFIEMNTRLQVEHPVSEMITGIDLVKQQIAIASGRVLEIEQSQVQFRGHAIECRINAEDPETFAPSPGVVSTVIPAGGPGVRVDSFLFDGAAVSPYYDSLVAKLIVLGQSREEAISRMQRALTEYVVLGIKTNIALHRRILSDSDFVAGCYDIPWLEKKFLKSS